MTERDILTQLAAINMQLETNNSIEKILIPQKNELETTLNNIINRSEELDNIARKMFNELRVVCSKRTNLETFECVLVDYCAVLKCPRIPLYKEIQAGVKFNIPFEVSTDCPPNIT